MAENKLADMSTEFAVKILTLTDGIKGHYSLVNQFERSGTSIGANLAEAECAISKKDFLAKVYIALKECAETKYWLELLYETQYLTKEEYKSIAGDCEELRRMLSATTRTMNSTLHSSHSTLHTIRKSRRNYGENHKLYH